MRLIRRETYRRTAWKNGGGISFEIAADESPEPGWRLALAAIDRDGPFSDYTGYDRTIIVVEGAGCTLEFEDGESARLELLQPCTFAGERRVVCRLIDGRLKDLNVMTRRGMHAHAVALTAEGNLSVRIDEWRFLYMLQGKNAGDTWVAPAVSHAESIAPLRDSRTSDR